MKYIIDLDIRVHIQGMEFDLNEELYKNFDEHTIAEAAAGLWLKNNRNPKGVIEYIDEEELTNWSAEGAASDDEGP